MPEWLSLPRLIDLILLGMALEAIWLFRHRRRSGHQNPPPMLLHLVSGALLLLAMKLALSGVSTLMVAATLGMAGLAHAADLRLALRGNG